MIIWSHFPSHTKFILRKYVQTSVGSMARVEDIEISCALASGATQHRAQKQSNCSEAATAIGFGVRADVAARTREAAEAPRMK